MATFNIISPKYSFVDFNPKSNIEKCCIGEDEVCLPVIKNDDLIFQFNIITATIQEANDVFNSPLNGIQLLLLDVAGNELHNWTVADNLLFEKYRTGNTQITYLWRNALTGLTNNLLQCDQCFSFKIKATATIGGNAEIKEATSNCFITKCNDCFTSILEYTNDEDYADFEYCNVTNPLNKVRLYMYLNQPKHPEDKAVYRLSGGAIRQTRSLITKEYQAQTEHFPENIHDKIIVALGHNSINIYSANYTGGISKSGEYDIGWDIELDLCKAPAKFKALATPFAIKNNNCQNCQPVSCESVAIIYNPGIYDAVVGEFYSYNIEISGDAPFTLSNVVKPSWMDIQITGTVIEFYGTPTMEESDVQISFQINNCTNNNVSFNENIDVVAASGGCVAVSIIGSPALPDAIVGTAYSYSFNLSGDTPFTLANIIKPAWMNIAVVGNSVVFSGTPNVTGTNVTVSFNITNCAGVNSVPFSDTLNIATAAQGDISFTCMGGSYDPIPFGVAGTYNWNMNINTIAPGLVHIIARNDQAGSLNGYSMYYEADVIIAAGQTTINVPLQYDGGGVHTLFNFFISSTDLSGTDVCDDYLAAFN